MKTGRRYLIAGVIMALILLVFVVVFFIKPADNGSEYDPYFSRMNLLLKAEQVPSPIIIIDMNRLDENINQVKNNIHPPQQFRLVTKSIPSLYIIRYILGKTGTRRLMAFHHPYISIYLQELGYDLDILLGKPVPVNAARKVFERTGYAHRKETASAVAWLVDTPGRLTRYLDLAKELQQKIRVSVELDVGLHRGGAATIEELDALLAIIDANRKYLRLDGFMGYDGHVPYIPVILGSREKAVEGALKDVMEKYGSFVHYLKEKYPRLYDNNLTFNSGGSKTYTLYGKENPVNDLAIGGCILKSTTYDLFTLDDHLPAIYIATPVLKILDKTEIPFAEWLYTLFAWWDPNTEQSLIIYGGGWAADYVNPPGLQSNPILSDPDNENLMPNQSTVNASGRVQLDVGDFVFYRPRQTDAMFQFAEYYLVRDGKAVGRWKPVVRRY
ncbi:MAG: alanine racemase [Spirochaetota bacterium]